MFTVYRKRAEVRSDGGHLNGMPLLSFVVISQEQHCQVKNTSTRDHDHRKLSALVGDAGSSGSKHVENYDRDRTENCKNRETRDIEASVDKRGTQVELSVGLGTRATILALICCDVEDC